MERLLWLYSLALDARFPVVCFDERPCFLIDSTVPGLAMRAGQVSKEHYEYKKLGSCALLMAIEPKTGKRLARVYDRRTKHEYAQFLKALAARYPKAEKIRLVQDNLNTHNASSFYENLSPAAAFSLAHRFEMHYTPKKGSWLNMAELELSALSRICLSRRIPSIEELDREVQAIVKERNELQIKVEWQFSITQAREKLGRHYEKVKSKN